MGYSAYLTNCYLKPSRELTKEEIKYIDEELDFDVGDNNIYLEEEYYGLCPDGYLQEDINRIIEYGNERGFTLNGSIDVDMTMGCCGKARYKIDNSKVTITESGEDFLEDYTTRDLIEELNKRGYAVEKKEI